MKPIAKISTIAFIIALFALTSSVAAQPKCKKRPVKDLVEAFAESFTNKTMASLDVNRPYLAPDGAIQMLVEQVL